jgi:hypothetical protein
MKSITLFILLSLLPIYSKAVEPPMPDKLSLQLLPLLELTNKEEIFTGLIKLKQDAETTYKTLRQSETYQPDLFYTANLLKKALKHVPDDYAELPDCEYLRMAMEYDYRIAVEEQEAPIPVLWLVLTKVCVSETLTDE